MADLLIRKHSGSVLELSLNRAQKQNALTLALYQQLIDALDHAENDDQVNVVMLSAQGAHFCAGNDIADFVAVSQSPDQLATVIEFLHRLTRFPKPLVAAVQGNAVGIGITMLLHCDLVVVADDFRGALPFVKLGLVPEGGSSLLFPQLIGHRHAFELLVEGKSFTAQKAVAAGVANQITETQKLSDTVLTRAAALAALPQQAVVISKQMLKSSDQGQLNAVIDKEAVLFAKQLSSNEAQAAFSQFLQRN